MPEICIRWKLVKDPYNTLHTLRAKLYNWGDRFHGVNLCAKQIHLFVVKKIHNFLIPNNARSLAGGGIQTREEEVFSQEHGMQVLTHDKSHLLIMCWLQIVYQQSILSTSHPFQIFVLLYYGEETNKGNCDVVGMPAAMEKEQEYQAWERNALLRMVRLPTSFEPMSKMLGLRPSVVLLASPASSSPVTTAAGTSIPILLVCFVLSSVAFNPNVLQTCLPSPCPAHTPSFLPRDSRQTESDPAITTRDKTFCNFDQRRRITLLKS